MKGTSGNQGAGAGERGFTLIESLLYHGALHRLDRHLARLRASAALLGFRLPQSELAEALTAFVAHLGEGRHKVRIELHHDGSFQLGAERVMEPEDELEVMLAQDSIDSGRPLAGHKTSRRDLFNRYAAAARQLGLADVLFLNERGELAEAANSNVFLEVDGELLTPPLGAGILPGVYRQLLLDRDASARVAVLYERHLTAAQGVLLSNSVRGLRRVVLRPGRLRP